MTDGSGPILESLFLTPSPTRTSAGALIRKLPNEWALNFRPLVPRSWRGNRGDAVRPAASSAAARIHGKRVLGDARQTSVAAIWTGETASTLRRDLNAGGSTFCGDCPLKLPLGPEEAAPQRPLHIAGSTGGDGGVTPLPRRLYVETTAACNISCLDACCAPETGNQDGQAGMLDRAVVREGPR